MAKDFNNTVFINCPFDKKNTILKPILFCLMSNGFYPTISLDKADSGQNRLNKIVDMMKHAKYSIHDLSILKSDKSGEYARMNMPFELGIDFGLRYSGENNQYNEKIQLILCSEKYEYVKSISDLGGVDPKYHGDSVWGVIDCLHSWLSTILDKNISSTNKMYNDYIDFNGWLYSTIKNTEGEDSLEDEYNNIEIPVYKNRVEKYLSQKEQEQI